MIQPSAGIKEVVLKALKRAIEKVEAGEVPLLSLDFIVDNQIHHVHFGGLNSLKDVAEHNLCYCHEQLYKQPELPQEEDRAESCFKI